MPRRKFGKVVDNDLKSRTRTFLQRLGYTSFVSAPIIDQLKPADLKIKYDRKLSDTGLSMKFETLEVDTRKKNLATPEFVNFEFIKITNIPTKYSFILYISEKNEWRCFVPTKGNFFCKKKKKAYGFCGCHSEKDENAPHNGSFDDEIQKRMQFAGYLTSGLVKVNNFSSAKGESTNEWEEDKLHLASTSETTEGTPKRACPPRCFEKISLIQDLVWSFLLFVPPEDLYPSCERVCKLWRNIILSEVFEKKRWEAYKKSKKGEQFGVMEYADSIGECVFVPGSFKICLDGVFESMLYKLNTPPTPPNYYDLNRAHLILPTLIDFLTKLRDRKKLEDEEKKRQGLVSNYFQSKLFPYPLCESFPQPIILRRDLDHKYVENDEALVKDLVKLNGEDGYKLDDMGYDGVDEALKGLRDIKKQTDRMVLFKKHTEAQRVISKILRAKVEYEYFDWVENGYGCKFSSNEEAKKYQRSNYDDFSVDQQQMKCSEYYKELVDFNDKESFMESVELGRVMKVVEALKLVCKKVTIYRASQLDMEELGHLWIVGEFSENFLIGYTWFLCAN